LKLGRLIGGSDERVNLHRR